MRSLFFLVALIAAFLAGICVPCTEARQLSGPEGAMGRDNAVLNLSCRIERAPRLTVALYRIICGGPESFVVSVDDHSMVSRWLAARVGRRVPITFGEDE